MVPVERRVSMIASASTPRDMDPRGKYNGFLVSDLMPLQRTQEGGALMIIDAANYSEANTPANSTVPAEGGQKQATAEALSDVLGRSVGPRLKIH